MFNSAPPSGCCQASMRSPAGMAVRIVAICAVLTLIISGLFVFAGCKAGEVRAELNKVEQRLTLAEEKKSAIDEVLAQINSGQTTPQLVLEALMPVLPESIVEKIRRGEVEAQDALVTAKVISEALGEAIGDMRERAGSLRTTLADAEDEDDATAQVIAAVAGAVGSLFGVGGPAFLVVNALARRKGASMVAENIALGRKSDPNLDAAFNSGPAHDLMKSDNPPWLDDVIRQVNQRYRV